jgi:AraC-like DNA-binding protein
MLTASFNGQGPRWGSDDPLSSVLLDLRLTGTFFCHSAFSEPWSMAIGERDCASFHFVAQGHCWLQLLPAKGKPAPPIELDTGDLVLVPRSPRQVFSSTKRKSGTPFMDLPIEHLSDNVSLINVGKTPARWRVICGGVRFEGLAAAALFDAMPEIILVRAAKAGPIVAGALETMRQESLEARPGSVTLMTRLADVITLYAIRSWLERTDIGRGWLAALRDSNIGRAMTEVHRRPEEPWSVQSMARAANLSRSRFSQRFTELLGSAPMQYVTKVRMQRAREMFRADNLSIAAVAERFGYDSEAAFARAFKRHVGLPPGAVRRLAAGE